MPSRRTVASAALGLALAPLVGRRGLAADGVPLAPGLAAGGAEGAGVGGLPGKRPPRGGAGGGAGGGGRAALRGRRPLIELSSRPPNYETPLDYFREPITPND